MPHSDDIRERDYRALAEFRYQVRRFLRFSEEVARQHGLEPRHHQAMLAIKGLPDGAAPTVGELAEQMQVQHHSAVELVDRLAQRGLVKRERSGTDRRQVLLSVTPKGERMLRELSVHTRAELRSKVPNLVRTLKSLLGGAHRARLRRRSADKSRHA